MGAGDKSVKKPNDRACPEASQGSENHDGSKAKKTV
jgi:hypothetical protein